MVNIISGGLHAGGNLDFQDFLIVPIGATSYSQALQMSVDVYAATRDVLSRSGYSLLKADEGGFGPPLTSNAAALDLLSEAIEAAGYAPGDEIGFAIDVAASHLYDPVSDRYHLTSEGRIIATDELIDSLAALTGRYPILSIEDGLSEDDWEGWRQMTSLLGERVQLIGDDLFSTNLARLEHGIAVNAANAVLIKMNQIGTLSETIAVVRRAVAAGFRPVISGRSGDTEDHALADLAVAMNAGQIKIGSVAQSERLAKYNQLLRIEEELGDSAIFDPAIVLGESRKAKEPLA
jgi:enolase